MRVILRAAEVPESNLTHGIDAVSYFQKLEGLFASELEASGLIPEASQSVELSVSILTDAEMSGVNMEYRKSGSATDVLSFPLWEDAGVFSPPADWESLPLGDIVICPAVIARNAAEEGRAFISELTLVLSHGMLHLIGYDHDSDEREKEMWDLQSRMTEIFLSGYADGE